MSLPRTLLICHADDPLNRHGLARWLASTTTLVGIVEIREGREQLWRRLKREAKRIGLYRLIDVLAFRIYYSIFHSQCDKRWINDTLNRLCEEFPPIPQSIPVLTVKTPNSTLVADFIKSVQPEIALARCKVILKSTIFSVPTIGTFAMHPGICPQYRNSHGCFWALSERDRENVGMTLLKIDSGVDTGPVHSYYRCCFDEKRETHVVIQHKVVFDNLKAIRDDLTLIHEGRSQPHDTSKLPSRTWGQPWLSSYLSYRWHARNKRPRHCKLLP